MFIRSRESTLLSRTFLQGLISSSFQRTNYKTFLFHYASNIGGFEQFTKYLPFDHVYDDTDSRCANVPRFIFNSVSDNIALNNAFDTLRNQDHFFAIIVTVTMHAPYEDPNQRGTYSYEQTTRFTDKAIGDFVKKLKDNGFFDNGILAITGDHHAMLPLQANEISRYGVSAITRVPLILVGKDCSRGPIGDWFDHCSLGNLLTEQAFGVYKINRFQIDPISYSPSRLILHQYFSPQDRVLVANKDTRIELNGDNTQFSSTPTDISVSDYLGYIAWLRQESLYHLQGK